MGLEISRVGSLHCLSLGLSWLGYPDRAWAKSREMLEVAQRSSNPFVLAQAFGYATLHNLIRGDVMRAKARRGGEVARRRNGIRGRFDIRDDLLWHGSDRSRALRGGRRRHAPGLLRLPRQRGNAARLGLSFSGLRARKPGRTSGTGGCFRCEDRRAAGRPWLHRVKGELLLAQNPSDVAEAERCFRTAIEIARRQTARSEELRATTSLARLLNEQGRRVEARTMLAEIYGWFTEGFDTADLKDAKALLVELVG